MSTESKVTSRIDYSLVLIIMLLGLTSCLAIYSAQTTGQYPTNFLIKQIINYIIGTVIVFIVIRLDSDQLKKMTWYGYAFGLFLLILVVTLPESLAPTTNGAKSWFKFPMIGSLQPSEFVKVLLVLTLARLITEHHEKNPVKSIKSDWWLLVKLGIATAVPIVLIMFQPDLGTALVFISILLGMIFISGVTWKILLPIFSFFVVTASTIFYFVLWKPEWLEKYLGVKQYQFGRIYSWLDPYNYQSSEGFQLTRSLLAIGSGGTVGKGYNHRDVYLPESHTDFIFSIIGEEFGFLGASILISLFFMLIYHITKMGMETKDRYYTYICVGVISMITFHVFQNIGMTIGVLPITGIPLPFISYGGSSLFGTMFAMGLIFSIRYHNKKYMFSSKD